MKSLRLILIIIMLSSFTAMMFFLFSENEVHKKYGYAAMLILVIGLVIENRPMKVNNFVRYLIIITIYALISTVINNSIIKDDLYG